VKGTRLLYSTHVGGPNLDFAECLATGPNGRVAVGGWNQLAGFPVTPGAFDTTPNGGVEGVIVVFDPVPQGVEPFGESRPACLGPLTLYVTEMPRAGSAEFGFLCSGAPPNAEGFLALSKVPEAASALALDSRVELPGARRMPVQSDARGFAELSLPGLFDAPGQRFRARFAFRNTPACPGDGTMSWSHGLEITVQP
jgi:hypothetical protein